MSNSIVSRISKNLMFRYRQPCHRTGGSWSNKLSLEEKHRIQCFGHFDDQDPYADVRVAWCDDGLLVTCAVTGKEKSLWCRSTQILESDSVQLWIDTRNTHNVHRATGFCHWIVLMPAGDGPRNDRPMSTMLKINRSKDDPPTMNRLPIPVAATRTKGGYTLRAHIPAACLHGWDPAEHRRIGFSVAVIDRELGWQTLGSGPEFPITEDPSLWHTIELFE